MNLDNNNNEFDDFFKKAFDNHEVKPPTSMWDKIENSIPSTEEIAESNDRIFKQAFLNQEVEPRPEMWRKIRRRLPINLVVKQQLGRLTKVAAILLVGMFAINLISEWNSYQFSNDSMAQTESTDVQNSESSSNASLVPTTDLNNNTVASNSTEQTSSTQTISDHSQIKEDELIAQAEFTTQPAPKKLENTASSTNRYFVKASTEKQPEQPIQSQNNTVVESLNPSNTVVASRFEDEGSYRITAIPRKDIQLLDINALSSALKGSSSRINFKQLVVAPENLKETNEKALDNAKAFQGAYLKAGLQLNSTSTLGTELISQVQSVDNSLVERLLTSGQQYMIGFGYKYNEKWAVETDLVFTSHNQNFVENTGNDKINTDIKLNYIQIPIQFKYLSQQLTPTKTGVIRYVAGVNIGVLIGEPDINASSMEQGEIVTSVEKTLFAKQTIGGLVGIDYDIFSKENLSLTIGGRLGVNSASNNSAKLFNTNFGIKAGVNYRIGR